MSLQVFIPYTHFSGETPAQLWAAQPRAPCEAQILQHCQAAEPELNPCQGLLSPAPAPASLGTRLEQKGRAAAPAPGYASLPAATCLLCLLPRASPGWGWGRGAAWLA